MQPVSDKAFGHILVEFSTSGCCSITCSEATYITLEEIGSICDPEVHDHDAFIFNKPNGNSEKESFIEGVVMSVYTTVMDAENKYDKELYEFLKDNTYERFDGSQPEQATSYTNFESFVKDMDFEYVKRNVKRCWDRSLTTEEPFSEEDLIKLLVGLGANDLN